MSITITNETIVQFYTENSNLNIEAMNLFFIDVIQKMSTNLSSTINESNISKILGIIMQMNSTMSNMDNSIQLRFFEMKKQYMDDVKDILTNSSMKSQQSIRDILDRNQDNMIAKTSLILNDYIPKTQELHTQLEKSMTSYFMEMMKNTNLLLQQTNPIHTKEDMIQQIEQQFNKMVSFIHQPICSYIQSSEERTLSQLETVKSNLSQNKQSSDLMTAELGQFLNKYKNNSSSKGQVSETELYYILQRLLPSDEIIRCSAETASGDFKVHRYDKSKTSILFENKNYVRSVDTEEIKKFERDVTLQKMHGILLSQNSPITYKNNFHIDVIHGNILVYVPNVEYNVEKIKIAIDIVDALSLQLQEMEHHHHGMAADVNRTMTMATLNDIIREYTDFAKQKMDIVDLVKSQSKLLLEKIDLLQLPHLNSYLLGTGHYKNEDLVCPHCGQFNGKNKSSLSSHIRHCKMRKAAAVTVPLEKEEKEEVVEEIIISTLHIF